MKNARKILSLLLATVFMMTSFAMGAVAKTFYGDVNQDGQVNAADALAVLKFAVNKQDFTPEEEKLGEVSADKVINAQDALLILQYAVGKIEKFPIEDFAGVTLGGTVTVVDSLAGSKGYQTLVAPVEIDEDFNTLTQINVSYNANYDLDLDCYLAYVYGKNSSPGAASFPNQWRAKKTTYHNDTKIGIMIAFNRDNGEYVAIENKGSTRDVQTEKNGTLIKHSQMTYPIYYMVPTKNYIEYKWQAINSYLEAGGVEVVALEEPELWNRSGYSEGFKAEYEDYYGEAWQDPETSAEAMWKNQYFKAYINKVGVEYLTRKIKENYPEVTVLIAAHSNFSYGRHGISTGWNMYASIPTVDGFIGQTWSDDAAMSMQYQGKKINDVFMSSVFAYNGYGEGVTPGQSVFLLQDPASDIAGSLEESVMLNRWKQTVVAAMMQDDTTSFQATIWPQRAFDIASNEYKIMQLNINRMYDEFDTLSGANYSGTPGIALGMSDSMGWQLGKSNMVENSSQDSISGMFCSLQEDGILLDTVFLDQKDEVLQQQLEKTNLLILAYDAIKPMNANANQIIAQWVKDGGRILYLAGDDAFSHASLEWWGEKNTTPFADLLEQLGLTELTVAVGEVKAGAPISGIANGVGSNASVNETYAARTMSFSGQGAEMFMTIDGKNVGFTANVGEGKAVVVGLPSAYYAQSVEATEMLRAFTALALKGSDTEYMAGDAFVSLRGNYFAYYSPVKENKTAVDKVYVDLFSPTLRVVPGGSVLPAKTAQLYYDVTELLKDTKPRIGFVGATEMEQREEKEDSSSCTFASPSNSKVSAIFFGNGKYPRFVEAYQGTANRAVETVWDPALGALVATVPNRNVAKPITMVVEWSDRPSEDFPAE